MARPYKQGMDYYPLSVSFLDDIKVRRIMRACGPESISVLLTLLSYVYGEEGYYIEWNEDTSFIIADKVNLTDACVQEIVSKATEVGFFDEGLYSSHSVLTSSGIQRRFLDAVKRRTLVKLEKDILLVKVDEYINPEAVEFMSTVTHSEPSLCQQESTSNEVSDDRSTQRREEKRRVEKSREEYIVEKQASQPPVFREVIECLNSNAGTNYRHTTKSHQRLIKARLNEGFELPDFETVILKKTAEWKGGDMEKFLRPETLFGTKFESYLNQQEGKQAMRTDADYDYYAQNPDVENPLDWIN